MSPRKSRKKSACFSRTEHLHARPRQQKPEHDARGSAAHDAASCFLHPLSSYSADNRIVAGVYISWPFCAQKCTHCNFASGVQPRELEARYANALIAEITRQPWAEPPDTVYIGGGTPSAIAP